MTIIARVLVAFWHGSNVQQIREQPVSQTLSSAGPSFDIYDLEGLRSVYMKCAGPTYS